MSIESLTLALHHSKATGTTKLVLLGIANHDGDGGAWPSVRTLAKYSAVTPRNVQKAIRDLELLGEIRVHRQAGGTPDMADFERPNRYEFLVRCPDGCDRSSQHRVSEATPPVGGDTRPPVGGDTRGVSEATPKPSLEPSLESSLDSPPNLVSPAPASAKREESKPRDPTFRDGHDEHPHEPNALAKCQRLEREGRLPIDAGELLAWCYRLGDGDPFEGSKVVAKQCERQLDDADDPAAALRSRLRKAVAA